MKFFNWMKGRSLRRKYGNRLRTRQKFNLRFSIIISLTIVGIFSAVLIFSNLFLPKSTLAAVSKYFSIDHGAWGTFIWSDVSNNSSSCGCKPSCNLGTDALIKHKLSVTNTHCSSFTISGGKTVDLNNGGALIISVPFTVSGGSVLNIDYGDSVFVYGNTTVSGGSDINVNGYLLINGNITLSGGSNICGSGQAFITGSISGSGSCFTSTLPITLASFDAEKTTDNTIVLSWATASEINNDYFTVERSADGKNFSAIGTQKGAGNSTQKLYYSLTDEKPINGNNYYRLRQTDYDGTSTVSGIVRVKTTFKDESVSFFPNPLRSGENGHIKSSSPVQILQIFNSKSELVLEKKYSGSNEENSNITVETDNLKPGSYYFTLATNDLKTESGKFIVQ